MPSETSPRLLDESALTAAEKTKLAVFRRLLADADMKDNPHDHANYIKELACSPLGNTALYYACAYDCPNTARALLDASPTIDPRTPANDAGVSAHIIAAGHYSKLSPAMDARVEALHAREIREPHTQASLNPLHQNTNSSVDLAEFLHNFEGKAGPALA